MQLMEAPQDFTNDIFFKDQERKLWPRRLLHVPSMTSIEREAENTYMGVENPEYNIVSYTWGRYAIPVGPSLSVKNVSWEIPPIDPSRFTVEVLEKVLQTISTGHGFVWIDIACIDQEHYATKMDEIGRQAGIFSNAQRAFVWLHGSSLQELQTTFGLFFDLIGCLDRDSDQEIIYDDNCIMSKNCEPDDSNAFISMGEDEFLPRCIKDTEWVGGMKSCLSQILGDVWFSSLWTLQEASLRPDSWIISKDGSTIPREGFMAVALANLLIGMGEIERHLSKAIYKNRRENDHNYDKVLPSLKDLYAIVQRIGLGSWENPATLYASARFRQCVDPLDRIYGIMQTFGFRLGAARDSSRFYSLDDLEHQFATCVNEGSPIMGQLFVHTKPVALGKCWRLCQDSEIGYALRFTNAMHINLAHIHLDHFERPVLVGLACDLRRIAEQWVLAGAKNEGYQFWSVDGAVHLIALDENEYWDSRIPYHLRHIETENFAVNQSLVSLLLKASEDDLQIFKLGRLLDPEDKDEDEDEDRETPTTTGSVGMLARPVKLNGTKAWQRLGICVWAMDPSRDDTESLWKEGSYVLA